MKVTVEGIDAWKNFDDFLQRMRKQEPIAAFLDADGDPTVNADSLTSPADTIGDEIQKPNTTPGSAQSNTGEPGFHAAATQHAAEPRRKTGRFSMSSEDQGSEVASKPRPPSVRSTGEFTFRIAEAPQKDKKPLLIAVGSFVGGIVLMILLKMAGILEMLPSSF
jgi:hypothetical protein